MIPYNEKDLRQARRKASMETARLDAFFFGLKSYIYTRKLYNLFRIASIIGYF